MLMVWIVVMRGLKMEAEFYVNMGLYLSVFLIGYLLGREKK